jgi:hypothetical protein
MLEVSLSTFEDMKFIYATTVNSFAPLLDVATSLKLVFLYPRILFDSLLKHLLQGLNGLG